MDKERKNPECCGEMKLIGSFLSNNTGDNGYFLEVKIYQCMVCKKVILNNQ